MKLTLAVLAPVLFLLPGLAFAQDRPDADRGGWSVGGAVIAADSPYVGEGTRVLPVGFCWNSPS